MKIKAADSKAKIDLNVGSTADADSGVGDFFMA
jgi:hypothetical protein